MAVLAENELLPRDWPKALRAAVQSTFQLVTANVRATSPYTGGVTPYGPQSQRFVCKLTSPTLKAANWRLASGVITGLRGIQGPVRMVDYHRMKSGYDEAISPTIALWSDGATWTDGSGWESGQLPPVVTVAEDADAGARSLLLRGYPANLKDVMRYGDLFEARPNGVRALHGHLYESTRNSRTNSEGLLRAQFEPGLRAALVEGDQIVLRYPTSVFRLASDAEGAINRMAPGNLGNFGLTLSEVLPDDVPAR